MGKLEVMQRLADREAAKLGVTLPINVVWTGTITWHGKPCKVTRNGTAHAHIAKDDPARGTICVRRGFEDWRDTIKHEVAHFAPGAHGHGLGYQKARAKQGDRYAKQRLRRAGKLRCAKHRWIKMAPKDSRATAAGLVITYHARCDECGKEIG